MSTAFFGIWTEHCRIDWHELYACLEAHFLAPTAPHEARGPTAGLPAASAAAARPHSTAMAGVWGEIWGSLHRGIRALKGDGEVFPVACFLDDSSREAIHLADVLGKLPLREPYRLLTVVCCRAAARRALDEELRQGHLLADTRGADPDDGFWVVLVRGRRLRCGLATVRSGQPRPLRGLEVTF
jgi:hypothetical protein